MYMNKTKIILKKKKRKKSEIRKIGTGEISVCMCVYAYSM